MVDRNGGLHRPTQRDAQLVERSTWRRRGTMRRIAVSVLALGMLLSAPAAVLAAAPSNNSYLGRTVIAAIPFNDTLDTTQANSGGNDVAINANCGAPATDASVWYSYTAGSDQNLLIDVSQSDYSAGLIVATGSPNAWNLV